MTDLPERVGYTVMFLQMTATEMHKLAEATPEIARELGHIAERFRSKPTASLSTSANRGQATASPWWSLSTADLLKFVLSVSQQFHYNSLCGFPFGAIKHVPVLRYPDAKTFNIILDQLSLHSCDNDPGDLPHFTANYLTRIRKDVRSLSAEVVDVAQCCRAEHSYAAPRSERLADTVRFPRTSSPMASPPTQPTGPRPGHGFYRTLAPCSCLNRATSAW